MAKIIVSIPYDGRLIFLRGVNFNKHEITINGNPTKLTRVEQFIIKDNQVVTDSYYFPIEYLMMLCYDNGAIDENNNLTNVE